MDSTDELVELPDDKESLQAMVRALQLERDQQKQPEGDLAQLLLNFAEALDRKPINPADLPPHPEPEEELRRVKRRKGRRRIADFENLPVTTRVHELSAEERKCRCCGIER